MNFTRMGTSAPRNTSNGDYGRFHFTSNMASNQQTLQQNVNYSTDGKRMFQHIHYPNCPNRASTNKITDGMKDYTVEYGEDAVRAALGGSMPDFQAQFQKQYGGGDWMNSGGINLDSKTMQTMNNNGQSKVAMIPVVLTNDEIGDAVDDKTVKTNEQSTDGSNSGEVSTTDACTKTSNNDELPEQSNELTSTIASEAPNQQISCVPSTSKQENITNAFDTVRKARSVGPVKYGRHVHPSYWKMETPNPCRKKISCGGSGDECNNAANGNEGQNMSPILQAQYMENANEMGTNINDSVCFPPPSPVPANAQQHITKAYSRSHSLPPKQTRPTYSLCGKCKKCRNLRSETSEASVLTFPKYSAGGYQRQTPHHHHHHTLTSSNLSQSAKNFRAIRFSSHHI